MIILTLRTDKPEAEIGLYDGSKQLYELDWQAHRQLAETIHYKIQEILNLGELSLKDLEAIVAFKGPGSFTGLRIGLSVGNALADSLEIPIVSATGEDWIQEGAARLAKDENEIIAMPEYGSPPHVTKPRK